MSVTFFCPEAGMVRNPLHDGCDSHEPTHISALPEVTMSNSSAQAILDLLGLQVSYEGSLSAADLPAAIQRSEAALKNEVDRAAFIEPACVNDVPLSLNTTVRAAIHESMISRNPKVTVVYLGRNDAAIVRNIQALSGLLKQACAENLSVTWA